MYSQKTYLCIVWQEPVQRSLVPMYNKNTLPMYSLARTCAKITYTYVLPENLFMFNLNKTCAKDHMHICITKQTYQGIVPVQRRLTQKYIKYQADFCADFSLSLNRLCNTAVFLL